MRQLVIAVVIFGFIQVGLIQATSFQCTSNGAQRNPSDCSSFYQCSNGLAVLLTCPSGLHYNAALKICDFPSNANCVTDLVVPSGLPTDDVRDSFVCPATDGFYGLPGQCSGTYYFCGSGVPMQYQCPGLTVFDPLSKRCVALSAASCNTITAAPTVPSSPSIVTTTTSTTRTTVGGSFVCPGEDGFYGIPGQCTGTYYFCGGGVPIQNQCPGVNVFDPSTKRCVPLSLASCNGIATTTTTTTTTTPTPTTSTTITTVGGSFVCPSEDGFYGTPGQCTGTYYFCGGGVPIQNQCPGVNVFDPLTKRCVPLSVASCYSTPTPSVTTRTPSFFKCPAQNGFFAVSSTCSSNYYICVDGMSYISTCPANSVFDPVSRVCKTLSSSSCARPFQCPPKDGFYPIPDVCSQNYVICIGGVATIQSCPVNSVYDPAVNKCMTNTTASC